MSIKKQFVELITFLQENENKKVSSILPTILEMAESKKQGSTFIKDADDNIVAIYCWYHKQWEIVADVPYGTKANSTTGLNTMCKVGVTAWTKKQRDAKKESQALLDEVMAGNILPAEIKNYQDDIEARRMTVDDTNKPLGYETEEEVREALGL